MSEGSHNNDKSQKIKFVDPEIQNTYEANRLLTIQSYLSLADILQ